MDLIKDLNGNTWSEAETRLYNQYTREIESTHQPDKIEFLKDQRNNGLIIQYAQPHFLIQ